MKYNTLIFVPFNIRNNIIRDLNKEIAEIPINQQYDILTSYMKKEDIWRGLEKRGLQNGRF